MDRLDQAYQSCQELARSHYENFPVASRLLPRPLRRHVAAIYAFARTADDFADELERDPAERLQLIEAWRGRLHDPATPQLTFVALHDTICRFELPIQLFDDLLDAFVQDVTVHRYLTWSDLLDYCRRSANPIGRLMLRLRGYREEWLDEASDAVCTALQLTNLWQDLAIDWPRGRLYVPEEIWRSHGADPSTLNSKRMTAAWVAALRDCSVRTRSQFAAGRPVCDEVTGRLRYELRATWLGGTRILDRLERTGFDVFGDRPTLGTIDALVIACGTLLWRETPPSRTRS